MKCEICGKDYPSKHYFKTDSICTECYKKQHPNEDNQEKEAKKTKSEPGESGTIGCFLISLIILIGGGILWLFRPADWGIPGIVCFIIIGIGLSGVKVGWDMLTKNSS